VEREAEDGVVVRGCQCGHWLRRVGRAQGPVVDGSLCVSRDEERVVDRVPLEAVDFLLVSLQRLELAESADVEEAD
jgi:hypothetical protein